MNRLRHKTLYNFILINLKTISIQIFFSVVVKYPLRYNGETDRINNHYFEEATTKYSEMYLEYELIK